MKLLFALSLIPLAPIQPAQAQTPPSPEGNPYASEIQPIFTKYCVACHNQSEHESNLKLQTLSSMLSGGDAGPALMPGKPESSLILRRIEGLDEPKMPPEDSPQPLPQDIAKIRDWIQKGAPGSDIEPSLTERWQRIAPNSQENRAGGNPSHKTMAITATAFLSPTQILLG
ncbi:MAG: c-type cytochrome domain-containing protein, partial [Pirellula sp.]